MFKESINDIPARTHLLTAPQALTTSPIPKFGSLSPPSQKLPFPPSDGKFAFVTFLRHCGCPFAEKTFLSLRDHASRHQNTTHIARSHFSPAATQTWLASVGRLGSVQVLVDDAREIYAQWGLGVSKSESRWQTANSFAVDGDGVVRWVRVMEEADEVPDFEDRGKVLGEEASWEGIL
ncbi:hypothetical protein JHW43_005252 [Diplocarpon mali]|nr:hypothetical protein JHW43_005252 [Diplocarpon mali]